MDRFSALPNELLDLISAKIPDYKSLFSLTLISRNFYDVFNCRLYRWVYIDGQLRTLALSPGERLPLTGSHPASFARTLHLYPGVFHDSDTELEEDKKQKVIREDLFKRQAASVLRNVARYGTLQGLTLWFPEIPLHEVFGNVDSTVSGHLRVLSLVAQASDILKTPSLNTFESLCQNSPSLACLDLQCHEYDTSFHADPVVISRLVERIPQTCPKLQEIRLSFSSLNQSHESIQRVVDDPSFTFPLLQSCHCDNFLKCNAFQFFVRHPGIENLVCSGITIGDAPFKAPIGFLPNIRYFSGYVSDYVALCTEYPPPIECLSLSMFHYLDAEEKTFMSGLTNAKTLRQLILSEFEESTANSLILLGSIIKACPVLTHFTCEGLGLGAQRPLIVSNLYLTILHDLPNLEHLLLRFQCSLMPAGDIFYSPHIQALSGHRSLRTVQISILVYDGWTDFCFVKEKDRVIVVPKSDLNTSRFHEFSQSLL